MLSPSSREAPSAGIPFVHIRPVLEAIFCSASHLLCNCRRAEIWGQFDLPLVVVDSTTVLSVSPKMYEGVLYLVLRNSRRPAIDRASRLVALGLRCLVLQ